MIAVRVIFADSAYNYETSINGTLEDARRYFVGQPQNFGDRNWGDDDNVQTPINVQLVVDVPFVELATPYLPKPGELIC